MTKVLIASLQRCGTQSTTKFLEKITSPSVQFSPTLPSSHFFGKNLDDIFSHVKEHEERFCIFSNAPYFALYDRFANEYPNMKFLLMTRKEEDWVRSFKQLIKIYGIDSMSMASLQKYLPDIGERYRSGSLSDEDLLHIYNTHNDGVISFFKNNKNFLHLDLLDKDMSKKIKDFLGVKSLARFEKIDNTKIYNIKNN